MIKLNDIYGLNDLNNVVFIFTSIINFINLQNILVKFKKCNQIQFYKIF